MMKQLTMPHTEDFSDYPDMLHSNPSFAINSHFNAQEKRDPKLKAMRRHKSFHHDIRRKRKSTKFSNSTLSAIGMKYQISEHDLVLYNEKIGGGNFGHM